MDYEKVTSMEYMHVYIHRLNSTIEYAQYEDGYYTSKLLKQTEDNEYTAIMKMILRSNELRSMEPITKEKAHVLYDKRMTQVILRFVVTRLFGYFENMSGVKPTTDKWIPTEETYQFISKVTGISEEFLLLIFGYCTRFYSEIDIYKMLVAIDRDLTFGNRLIEKKYCRYEYEQRTMES